MVWLEMGLEQVSRIDPTLVQYAPPRLELPPSVFSNPKPWLRESNRVVLPVKPMKLKTDNSETWALSHFALNGDICLEQVVPCGWADAMVLR